MGTTREQVTSRRSVSNGSVTRGGVAVGWCSLTQKCVRLSTTEAKHVALAESVKETTYQRRDYSRVFFLVSLYVR